MKNGNGAHYPGSELQRDIELIQRALTVASVQAAVLEEYNRAVIGLLVELLPDLSDDQQLKRIAKILVAVQKKRAALSKEYGLPAGKKSRRKKK